MKPKTAIIIGILIVTVAIGLGWFFKVPADDTMGHAILAFTAWAIVWYTLETRRLADVTERQLHISLQPIVVATQIMPEPRLLNIGKSSALHVTFEDVKRGEYTFKLKGWELCLVHDSMRDQSYGVPIEIYDATGKQKTTSGEVDRIKRDCLPCRGEHDTYLLFIHYDDIAGGKWKSTCKVKPNGISLEKVEVVS